MKLNIQELENKSNNIRINGTTYISPNNMYDLLVLINKTKMVPNILITPYLVNAEESKVYELHYYAFDIDVVEGETKIKEFNKNNILPAEIVQGIVPGIYVSSDNYSVAVSELKKYLDGMEKMSFVDIIKVYPFFQKENLCYQVF